MSKRNTVFPVFSCDHLNIKWPTSFCVYSQKGGGCNVIFSRRVWTILVDYCFGSKPTQYGPKTKCDNTFKRAFTARVYGDVSDLEAQQRLQYFYERDPSFPEIFFSKYAHILKEDFQLPVFGDDCILTQPTSIEEECWVRDLTEEGIESNPGPCCSKMMRPRSLCDLWKACEVPSQIFGDFLNIPSNINVFTKDFSTFVEKMPSKSFFEDAFENVMLQADKVLTVLSQTTQTVKDAIEQSVEVSGIFKNIVLGVLVVSAFGVLANYWGCTRSLIFLVISFLLHYFGLLDYLKDFALDYGSTFYNYFKQNFSSPNVVPLQGFSHPVIDLISVPDNLGALLAALFTVLFVGSVKMHPSTRDFEDLSRKVFNYQRGAVAVTNSFDKLKDFWTFAIEKISDRLSLNFDSEIVSKYKINSKINNWIQANNALFKKGFSHMDPMEKRALSMGRLKELYNEGLDLVSITDKLDRSKSAIVMFWVQKLHAKVNEMSADALEGEIRNPPTTILLYGSSGAGKSSLITSLASFVGKLHSSLTNTPQPATGSVYVRNCDQAHYDGYSNQFTLVIDDFLSRKDTEAGPNLEAGELIKIKNNVPFPLPMAHLPDKGRFLNSEVVILTTNCKDVSSSLGSMNFPYATANRLSDVSFACRVRPAYRKFIPIHTKEDLVSRGLFDQHSVDPYRAQFNLIGDCNIPLTDDHLLSTLSDQEFDKIKGDLRRLPNEQIQRMNFDLYYFQKLDVKTGRTTGPYFSWSEFLSEIELVYSRRISLGGDMLQQTKWFHETSLASMKKGLIDVPGYVGSQINDEFIEEEVFVDSSDDDLAFALEFVDKNYDVFFSLEHAEMDMMFQNYLDRWPNFCELLEQKRSCTMVDRVLNRWNRLWEPCKQRYEGLKARVANTDYVRVMIWASVVTYGLSIAGAAYYGWQYFKNKSSQPQIQKALSICKEATHEQNKNKSWFQRIFGGSTPISVSRDQVPLSGEDLVFLFDTYGYNVVQSQHDSKWPRSQARPSSRCATTVPSHSFDLNAVSKLASDFDLKTEMRGDTVVVFANEGQLPGFLVHLQSCQLTDQFLDYVLPANIFMFRVYSSKKNQFYNFGNVFFIQDRKFVMPHHYMMMLNYQTKIGNIGENDEVSFLRGMTTLERGKNKKPNKITCRVSDLSDYAQVISSSSVDCSDVIAKDAVVVAVTNMSGFSCADMVKKFVTRDDFAKFNTSGASGYLVVQRFSPGSQDCYPQALPCLDITPINKHRFISKDVMDNPDDLIGIARAGPESNPVYFRSLIRDRYNYKAATREGDCGGVLFVESGQLQRPLVGIHVSGDKMEGRANSVPLTQEDLLETMSRLKTCDLQGFLQPDLDYVEPTDLDDFVPNLPTGDFHYVGKLKGKTPIQPLKTAIRPSDAQIYLHDLKRNYQRLSGVPSDFKILKGPAELRVRFDNPEGCRVYFGKSGQLFYQSDGPPLPLTKGLYDVWVAKGGIMHDPLMKGLAKVSTEIPYIPPDKIKRAVNVVKQKFLRRGPNTRCPWETALAQNFSGLDDSQKQDFAEFKNRHALISDTMRGLKSNYSKYEKVLRTISLSKEEHKIFQKHLDSEDFESDVLADLTDFDDLRFKRDFVTMYGNPMVLSIKQAIQGIEGDKYIKSINSKKSPGWPWTSQGLNFGKKPWVGKECKCDGEKWDELEKAILDLEEKARHGIPDVYFTATLKDELKSLEKIVECKTRVFCAGPMHFTILFRQYFMRFLAFVMENRLFNESALGINPFSKEWEALADLLNKWEGPTCIAGDYSNFDGSLSNQIMEAILDIVLAFYAQFGATEEEQNIRRNLWRCLTRTMVIGRNGCVFRLFNSQPSGNPFTTIINILFNCIVFRMAYDDIMSLWMLDKPTKATWDFFRKNSGLPKELFDLIFPSFDLTLIDHYWDLKRSIWDFDSDVIFFAYGDDNVANINPLIFQFFNMNTISLALKQYGLTYTDESKSGHLVNGRFLREISFLKRGFNRVDLFGRRWVAPLDIDTVKEMCMWVRKGDALERKNIMKDILTDTLSEISLHGKSAYDDWSLFVRGFEDSKLLGQQMINIPDFESQFFLTCNRDYDSDQF